MTIPRRGLRDVLSPVGRGDQLAHPYRAYMQITCLEMERARRNQERKAAKQRIAIIDARLREVETEKAALLQSVGERIPGLTAKAPAAGSDLSASVAKKGFKIRY
jgi:hypothetical protein